MKRILSALLFILFLSPGIAQKSNPLLQHDEKKLSSFEAVSFFVRGDKNALQAYLKQIGGTYKYSFRNYHHITIPGNKTQELLQQPFITFVDYHHQNPVSLNDSMRVKARVNQIHQGLSPLPHGYTGKGIVVGFIDDGIDFNHPDFLDTAGNTRVLAIWDHTQPYDAIRTPAAYGYGQVWDSVDINAGLCTSVDNSGHGTTVAGTACGNGFSTGTHAGAAPDSWVVMVKQNSSFPNWSNTVADAVDYIYKLADSLGMPCVINASVGDYYGSHDGRDLPSQYMDSLIQAKRGRLMVAALGNSGQLTPYHLETYVDSDTSFTWFKYNASSFLGYGAVFFEAFADTNDISNVWFSMGADKTGAVFKHRGQAPFRNVNSFLGTTLTDTIFSPANDILGIVDYYAEYQGDVALLQIHMKTPDSSAYNFRFSTTGNGHFDVWSGSWLGVSNIVNTGVPLVADFPDMAYYVSPDSAKTMVSGFQNLSSIVTVANYNNIQNYIGYDGNPVALGEAEGAISSTSSRGPTRDNRQKPDVAATGNVTFSPGPLPILANLIAVAPHKLLPDGMHMRNGGTSMASPVVAGIGALLLERCPQMSWDEFKTYINSTAYTDGFTGAVPNISFGYGKVNAYDAMLNTVYTPVLSADSLVCDGGIANLYAPAGFQSYTWSNGAGTNVTSTDSSGNFWMVGTDVAGCLVDTAYVSATIHPNPVVSIVLDTTFHGNAAGAIGYQWYMNGSPISGETDTLYDPISNGNYFVSATTAYGCVGYSDTISFINTGIDESSIHMTEVYPNPFTNEIIIASNENFVAEIRNELGEILFTGHNTKRITTDKWASGIYYVLVRMEKKQEVYKLIRH